MNWSELDSSQRHHNYDPIIFPSREGSDDKRNEKSLRIALSLYILMYSLDTSYKVLQRLLMMLEITGNDVLHYGPVRYHHHPWQSPDLSWSILVNRSDWCGSGLNSSWRISWRMSSSRWFSPARMFRILFLTPPFPVTSGQLNIMYRKDIKCIYLDVWLTLYREISEIILLWKLLGNRTLKFFPLIVLTTYIVFC